MHDLREPEPRDAPADARLVGRIAEGADQEHLDELISAWTATIVADELLDLMDTGGVPAGRIYKAADMLVEIENAKSLTYYAAWAMDENVPEAPLAASMAKAYVSDAFRKAAGTGIQLHGGIGFTWEHDLHLYFKRAKSSEFTFGDATWHRERVAQLINL